MKNKLLVVSILTSGLLINAPTFSASVTASLEVKGAQDYLVNPKNYSIQITGNSQGYAFARQRGTDNALTNNVQINGFLSGMSTINPTRLAGKTTIYYYNVPDQTGTLQGGTIMYPQWVYPSKDNSAAATLKVINSSGSVVGQWTCKTTSDFGTGQSVWLHFGVDSSVSPVKGQCYMDVY